MRRLVVVVVVAVALGCEVAQADTPPPAGCEVAGLVCEDFPTSTEHQIACRVPIGADIARVTLVEESNVHVTHALELRGACTYATTLLTEATTYSVVAADAMGHVVFTARHRLMPAPDDRPPTGLWPLIALGTGAAVGGGLWLGTYKAERQHGQADLASLADGFVLGIIAMPTTVCVVGAVADQRGSCALAVVMTYPGILVGAGVGGAFTNTDAGLVAGVVAATSVTVLGYYMGRIRVHEPPPVGGWLISDRGTLRLGIPIAVHDREHGQTTITLVAGRF